MDQQPFHPAVPSHKNSDQTQNTSVQLCHKLHKYKINAKIAKRCDLQRFNPAKVKAYMVHMYGYTGKYTYTSRYTHMYRYTGRYTHIKKDCIQREGPSFPCHIKVHSTVHFNGHYNLM